MVKAYLVDVGVLLPRDDEDFKYYSKVYNNQYGFYDEDRYYSGTLEQAMKDAKFYVRKSEEDAYAVISSAMVDNSLTDNFDSISVDNEDYSLENVIYSCRKKNGQLIEGFV